MSANVKRILAACFLALGVVLPLFIGQVPSLGRMLLPMHIPVLLCAFICGKRYAVPMAMLLPLVRYALFSLPAFPLIVAAELAIYALTAGCLIEGKPLLTRKNIGVILAITLVCGRLVRMVLQIGFLLLINSEAAIPAFLADTMLVGLVGGVLHWLLLPPLLAIVHRRDESV